ncbi:ATPase, P-type (transporting), HAD superfamily, subfamily IC [Thermoplasmatales archaeon BRNA1]|nr:ATPase, P-type (transporting), HAD superfamily, subfamily IC [Thermoplasmatales archaeon BRNA1]
MQLTGLTEQEVQERSKAGMRNGEEGRASQSYLSIFLRNLLTPFNIILFVIGAALLAFHDVMSAVAATGVIAFNIIVSTFQEFKAKRRLDKIALLFRPKATVVRDGKDTVIDRADIVMGDIVHLCAGDQAQVDGEIIEERSIEMDESLLTGESNTVRKHPGEVIYSGSVCVTGECWFQVNKVGNETFSSNMTAAAKKVERKTTPLQKETNAVTEFLIIVAFFFMFVLAILDAVRGDFEIDGFIRQAVIVLDIVPIALFLLITLTYMIAAVHMADSGVLLQNSSSVESMSHVDTVCMDKTGTITTNNLVFEDVFYYTDDRERSDRLIREFASTTGSRNKTVIAIQEHFGEAECELLDEIQFSSERKFSAVRVKSEDHEDTIVMGAWSVLKKHTKNTGGVEEKIDELSAAGLRSVVLFDGGRSVLHMNDEIYLPELTVFAVIAIRDEVRPDCKEIIHQFTSNGMDVKVISGDNPDTVEALFSLAEIPGERKRISGDELSQMSEEMFDKTVLETNIFGRMKPEQKERVIDSLKRNGRYVAMVGDGVNDVRSIKKAQVGVSMETASGAARGVADMILMKDDFTALPKAIVEGKRTVSSMRDILRLYLARNFVLMFIVLVLLIGLDKVPLLPIQNTLYAFITVSIAAFFMTLFAKPTEGSDMVLPGVLRYVLPTTFTIVAFGIAIYFGVYYAIGSDFLDIDDLYQEMFEAVNGGYYGHFDTFAQMTDSIHIYNMETDREIVAHNAMLLFLMMAGIAQLVICFPIVRCLSVDKQFVRRYLPTMLALLMFASLVAVYFAVPYLACKFLALVVFPPWFFILMMGITVVWAVADIIILKSRRMDRFNDRTEELVRKLLLRSYEKRERRARAKAEKDRKAKD